MAVAAINASVSLTARRIPVARRSTTSRAHAATTDSVTGTATSSLASARVSPSRPRGGVKRPQDAQLEFADRHHWHGHAAGQFAQGPGGFAGDEDGGVEVPRRFGHARSELVERLTGEKVEL